MKRVTSPLFLVLKSPDNNKHCIFLKAKAKVFFICKISIYACQSIICIYFIVFLPMCFFKWKYGYLEENLEYWLYTVYITCIFTNIKRVKTSLNKTWTCMTPSQLIYSKATAHRIFIAFIRSIFILRKRKFSGRFDIIHTVSTELDAVF